MGWTLLAWTVAGLASFLTIFAIGVTGVFVPQVLQLMRTTPAVLSALNPRLTPRVAHDWAGAANVGTLVLAVVWRGRMWRAIAVAATIGFGTAVGVHPAVGYNSPVHMAAVVAGAVAVAVGLGTTRSAVEPTAGGVAGVNAV